MAIFSTRAGAPLRRRGSGLLWRLSSSCLRDAIGIAEKDPCFGGGRSNQAGGNHTGRRLEMIHSDASGANPSDHYKVAVIGAGPAGLAVLSTLLDIGNNSILWIDPHFNAGRLSTYTEVPSNTKVKLFQQYVTTSPSLNRYARLALAQFDSLDPDQGCSLGLAVRMIKTLTDCIRQHDSSKVSCSQNPVKELSFLDGKWHLNTGQVVDQVYLATGSAPTKYRSVKGVQHIDLDLALKPSILPDIVTESDSVGVVGSSHSAMLALRNLVDCKVRPKKIINFYRSPLLYAQYMDNWILYDNTGLKGEVADWVKNEIGTGNLEANQIVTRICVKDRTFDEQLELWRSCTKLIQAVGFTPNALPKIIINGEELVKVEYDPLTGKVANGLFGYWIAFPELTTDPHGNQELAVGMWKFMRFARETVSQHARLQFS